METPDAPVFASTPPDRMELPGGEVLARAHPDRAAAAAEAVNSSLEHLRPWMAWAAEPATEAGLASFFAAAEALWDQCRDFGFSIVDGPGEQVLGGCGLHARLGGSGLEIGYWVRADRISRGLATQAARALTGAAFSIEGIELVRIQCDPRNIPSGRVPAKLGYELQGVMLPDEGPCAGRPTQRWTITRRDWLALRRTEAP